MESELAQVTSNKISRGVYQTTQPIDLRKLRRMLNEGGRGQDQAQDDDDEEDEDMESTSDISIEAHEGEFLSLHYSIVSVIHLISRSRSFWRFFVPRICRRIRDD
jgi:hypothetical protein